MNKVKNNHSIKMEKNEKNDEYIKNIEDELKKAKEAATKEPLGFLIIWSWKKKTSNPSFLFPKITVHIIIFLF
ncbi:hypothetical protein ACT7C3_03640 [Bacillus pacificus]